MINRVLLGDAKPGSVSNPILIDIDIHGTSGGQDTSEQDDSDGDTVRLSTPDFYEILRDGGTTGSQKKSALTNSPPVVTPSKLYGQTFDFTCSLKPKSTACAHHEGKRPELTGASEEASKRKNNCATLTLESHIASRGQAGVSGPGQGVHLRPVDKAPFVPEESLREWLILESGDQSAS
ncbi:hypothetical protein CBS147330_9860 [Penicillium roqueforti]|nr:hypothetical protein CBS147330_9860 [Penicillium roqueforti]